MGILVVSEEEIERREKGTRREGRGGGVDVGYGYGPLSMATA